MADQDQRNAQSACASTPAADCDAAAQAARREDPEWLRRWRTRPDLPTLTVCSRCPHAVQRSGRRISGTSPERAATRTARSSPVMYLQPVQIAAARHVEIGARRRQVAHQIEPLALGFADACFTAWG